MCSHHRKRYCEYCCGKPRRDVVVVAPVVVTDGVNSQCALLGVRFDERHRHENNAKLEYGLGLGLGVELTQDE